MGTRYHYGYKSKKHLTLRFRIMQQIRPLLPEGTPKGNAHEVLSSTVSFIRASKHLLGALGGQPHMMVNDLTENEAKLILGFNPTPVNSPVNVPDAPVDVPDNVPAHRESVIRFASNPESPENPESHFQAPNLDAMDEVKLQDAGPSTSRAAMASAFTTPATTNTCNLPEEILNSHPRLPPPSSPVNDESGPSNAPMHGNNPLIWPEYEAISDSELDLTEDEVPELMELDLIPAPNENERLLNDLHEILADIENNNWEL